MSSALGLPPLARKFAIGSAISSLGTGLFLTLGTVFFASFLRLPANQISVALSLGALAGLLLSVPLGRLSDRFGARRMLVTMLCIRAVAYGGLAFVHDIYGYSALVIVGLAGDYTNPPLQQAVVGQLFSTEDRTVVLGMLRSIRNLALTIGLMLGGLILAWGSPLAIRCTFVLNGISFALFAGMIMTIASSAQGMTISKTRSGLLLLRQQQSPLTNPSFLLLIGANSILLLYSTLLDVLPLWIVRRPDIPTSIVSIFLAINTALTIVLQVWLPRTRFNTAWKWGIFVTTGLLILTSFLFGIAERQPTTFYILFTGLGVIAFSLAENIHSIAAWNLSYAIAEKERLAEYLGVFNLGNVMNSLIGPLLIIDLIFPTSLFGWGGLAVLFTLSGFLIIYLGQQLVEAQKEKKALRNDHQNDRRAQEKKSLRKIELLKVP